MSLNAPLIKICYSLCALENLLQARSWRTTHCLPRGLGSCDCRWPELESCYSFFVRPWQRPLLSLQLEQPPKMHSAACPNLELVPSNAAGYKCAAMMHCVRIPALPSSCHCWVLAGLQGCADICFSDSPAPLQQLKGRGVTGRMEKSGEMWKRMLSEAWY